ASGNPKSRLLFDERSPSESSPDGSSSGRPLRLRDQLGKDEDHEEETYIFRQWTPEETVAFESKRYVDALASLEFVAALYTVIDSAALIVANKFGYVLNRTGGFALYASVATNIVPGTPQAAKFADLTERVPALKTGYKNSCQKVACLGVMFLSIFLFRRVRKRKNSGMTTRILLSGVILILSLGAIMFGISRVSVFFGYTRFLRSVAAASREVALATSTSTGPTAPSRVSKTVKAKTAFTEITTASIEPNIVEVTRKVGNKRMGGPGRRLRASSRASFLAHGEDVGGADDSGSFIETRAEASRSPGMENMVARDMEYLVTVFPVLMETLFLFFVIVNVLQMLLAHRALFSTDKEGWSSENDNDKDVGEEGGEKDEAVSPFPEQDASAIMAAERLIDRASAASSRSL
ncbi:unnamed protein product, partial [Amoebophrya sp. A25]